MPNNNVAILSIISKFDEKSAREAAKRADKVYEEALSDIGNVNFDKKLIENFDKAMNLLKNKFKKVNLSSYTNSLLDSIFSDKDIKEKSKDIELFISKIEMLKKASSGQDINAFNTFSAKQIDALISRTEKLAQKQEEINEKTREYNREATKIAKANRSITTIDKNYGNQDYSKILESLKKSLGTEKEFTAEQNQSIENLAKMVNLYQAMEKSEPQKGTAEAIRYSKDLLAVTQKIKEERDKIDAFSQKGASTYIANNGLSSIDKVSDYTVNKSKEDFVKASLSNLKSQEAKLQSELTTYISESVQKNLVKVSKEVDAVVDKAEKRVENLQNKIESLQSKPSNAESNNSVIGNIVSDSDIKSLEEIEDRLYAISDLDADGEATKQQLKEYIQLYKQYEQLIANDSTVKFDPGLKEEYDSIVESDSKLKKYADTLDETISKQKELNAVKSNENEVSVDTQIEQLAKQEEQAKETAKAEKNLSDIQDETISNIQKELEITKNEIIELSSRITNLEDNSFPILSDQIKDVTNNVDTLKQKVSTLFDSFKSTKEIEALSVLIHGGNLDILNSLEYKKSDALLKNIQNMFSGTGSDYGMVTGGGIFGLNDMSGIDKTDVNPNAKWYAIDYSKYHTYMVETEQEAEKLNQFMQRLNLMIVKNLGVDGKYIAPSFQDMYKDVNIDSLFLEYQQSFKGANLSLDEFKNAINEITERVKKAGFELYNDDEYSYTGKNARVSQEHAYDDDISTMFYKKHGYQGFNAQKLKDSDYNSYVYGSTIFDIDKENPYFKVFETYEEAVEYMKQVRDKIDNNQTVFYEYVEKSNGKYKEELEETNRLLQEQSRLIDEIQRKLSNQSNSENATPLPSDDKTNISSVNETPKNIENTTNAITEQTNALKELILSWVEAQKVMSKSGSASTEKIAVGNLSNGFVSNSNFTGDLNSISDKLIRNIIENATETVDTIIHSHPDYNMAAFSPEDIASSIIRFATGIQNQIIVGMDEISIMDVSKIKDINPLEIKNKIEQELSSLINSYIKNQLQSIDNLQSIFTNNLPGGLDEWSTFTDLISKNTNSDFLKNVIQKYKDSISDALINMGSDYKFTNSDELGTFIYENIIRKYVRSYVSNSNPDINQSEYDALQKEALENFKKEFSAIYDKAFSIKDYESLLTDNEIQPIVKEAFSNILKTFGLKYEDVIRTISVEQLKTSSISPMKDVFQGDDNSNTSFSSNLDEIEKEKSALLELRNAVSLITEEIDRKTQAFHNEKSAVDLIIPEEIATLESLERELKIIIESIEQISKIPINIDFNLENLDENSANAISKLKDSLSGFNGSSLTNISSILEGFKISKANVENLQKLANAILTLKSNLNNVGNSGQQFLSDIKELVAQSDGLKNLATVLKSSKKQIDNAKKTTNANVDSKNTEENANAWKELTYSIQRYSEVSKRISSGKALESDIEEASRLENKISQLQKLDILSPTQIEKSEQMLTKLYDSLDDIEKKSKEATLESLNSSIDKYRNDYNSRSSKLFTDNQSEQYKKLLANYKTSIKELESYRDKISNNPLVSKEDLNQIDELKKKVKESVTAFNSLTASQKGSTPLSRGKTIEWANDLLEQNSKWSKKAKIEVQGWINKLATADPSNVEEIRNRILEIVRAEREAGNAGKTWLDIFSTKKLHSFLGQAASMFSFYDAINGIKECITTVRKLDTALTEMRKVSDEGLNSLKKYQDISFDVADEIGSTALALQDATATWMRLGESLSEASESAKDATILMNVSEFESIDEATDSLVSMSQAFKELDKMEIIDVLDKIGNEYSISTDNLSRALQDSAAVLKTQGNDLYESVALITAGNAINQDYSKTAGGIRTISLRLAGTEEAKEELSSLGEDVDDFIVQTNSKTQELIKDYTAVASNAYKGIDVLDANGNLRNTYNILLDISKIYKEIQEEDKKAGTNRAQALVEYIAGKNRSNIASSILLNPELLESVYESAKNAEGAAMKELDAYMQSLDAKVAQFQNRLQELESDLVNSDFLKGAIDFGTEFIHILDEIINKFGVLPTIMAGVGVGLGIKNIGREKCYPSY